jgi:hypothetical protein
MIGLLCATCLCQRMVMNLINMFISEGISWVMGVCEWACWDMGDRLWGMIFSQFL